MKIQEIKLYSANQDDQSLPMVDCDCDCKAPAVPFNLLIRKNSPLIPRLDDQCDSPGPVIMQKTQENRSDLREASELVPIAPFIVNVLPLYVN